MEKFISISKKILNFILITIAVFVLADLISVYFLADLMKSWIENDSYQGFPRICYINILTFIIIYLLSFFIYKKRIINRNIYIMSIISIILLFIESMFGILGCFCTKIV